VADRLTVREMSVPKSGPDDAPFGGAAAVVEEVVGRRVCWRRVSARRMGGSGA